MLVTVLQTGKLFSTASSLHGNMRCSAAGSSFIVKHTDMRPSWPGHLQILRMKDLSSLLVLKHNLATICGTSQPSDREHREASLSLTIWLYCTAFSRSMHLDNSLSCCKRLSKTGTHRTRKMKRFPRREQIK